ncbi:putative major capsid protein [Bdellovibrio phage MAC3UK]|nr:putative major capsid protein [Bdellovibrio phage MAC3UK]
MTNKLVQRSIEEFLTGYKPAYNPILPLFMDNAQQYAIEAGKVTFQRAEAIGDLRGRLISPKDTEIHQVHSREGSKVFRKYFLGAQYIQSSLQDTRGYEDVVAQVMDEHNKQADEIFLTGEGTSDADVKNNGLFYSQDGNYVKKASATVAKDTAGNHFAALYSLMISSLQEANDVDGDKLILVYGDTMIAKYNGLLPATEQAFSKVFADATPEAVKAKIPKSITPAGNGFIIVNRQQVKLHYTTLPKIDGQGINEEKKYAWTNFLMGSSMLEVLALGGVIHQPVTFAP